MKKTNGVVKKICYISLLIAVWIGCVFINKTVLDASVEKLDVLFGYDK